jgi:hypothetical protein
MDHTETTTGDRSGTADRARVMGIAQALVKPFAATLALGKPLSRTIPFEAATDTRPNRKAHNAIEAIIRLLAGLAPLLEAQFLRLKARDAQLERFQTLLVQTIKSDLHLFTTPATGGQALVEAALLAQALLRAPNALWASMPEDGRDVLRRALEGSRNITPNKSNWMLFPAMVETALIVLDQGGRPEPVQTALKTFQDWYLGDGCYGDGPLNSFDYYGGYIIHPMLAQMADCLSPRMPEWAAAQPVLRARFDRYCEVLERLVAPDGTFPPLGRSLSYRAAAFQPLAMAAMRPKGHPTLGWGRLRTALLAVIGRTMQGDHHFDRDGWLRVGLAGSQPELAETYISTGSLYMASQPLIVLGLPQTHPFWTAPAEPISQSRIWHGEIPPGPPEAADIALEKRKPPGVQRI